MAAVVIADSGPLIALARVDRLEILNQLFSQVVIPEAVREECLAISCVDSERIRQALSEGKLGVEPVAETALPLALSRSLGKGEIEAIQLARQHGNALLILDDALARKQAKKCGLAYIGVVRLLAEAEQRGLIDSAERIAIEMSEGG